MQMGRPCDPDEFVKAVKECTFPAAEMHFSNVG